MNTEKPRSLERRRNPRVLAGIAVLAAQAGLTPDPRGPEVLVTKPELTPPEPVGLPEYTISIPPTEALQSRPVIY
jgi:hypothetical protein